LLQSVVIGNPTSWPGIRWINCRKLAMTGKNQHVVPHQDGWAVKGAGNQRATSVHDTQQQAIDAGRDIARNQQSELVIHRPNGRIRDKDSHGHDTFPPKG
jgi:hypothetical protein